MLMIGIDYLIYITERIDYSRARRMSHDTLSLDGSTDLVSVIGSVSPTVDETLRRDSFLRLPSFGLPSPVGPRRISVSARSTS